MKPLQAYFFMPDPDVSSNDVVKIIRQRLENPSHSICGQDYLSGMFVVATFADELMPRRIKERPEFFSELLKEVFSHKKEMFPHEALPIHLEKFRSMRKPPRIAQLDITYPAPAS